jgi:hypothetical protein
MFVASLLLMKVVLPQMYDWFSINNEVVSTRKRIAAIDENIAYVNSLNTTDLSQKRTVFVRALPYEKDIQGILTTISSSAISSGAKIDDFSLTIGELAPKSAVANLAMLKLTLGANGSPQTIQKFIVNLQTRLPLITVTSIDLNTSSTQIGLSIFYKPLPVFKVNDAEPIQKISGKFEKIFATLSQWSANSDSVLAIPDTITRNKIRSIFHCF